MMNSNMNTLLWVDDCRDPFTNPDWLCFSPVTLDNIGYIAWVKDYTAFVDWIETNGLPYVICFDHDLGEAPESGFTCAKWLVEYCMDNNKELPYYASQSSNPCGRENILSLLDCFKKNYHND